MEIKIQESLRNFISPLSKEESYQLEENLLREGCLDPLIVWKKGTENILVDGHNRYGICSKHNISYKVVEKQFANLDEVKVWMVNNQLGRRNLTSDQLSYLRGSRYLLLKKKKGGYENRLNKGAKSVTASQRLSDMFNVSESTIKRDAKFAKGLGIITKSNPSLKTSVLLGNSTLKKKDIQELSDFDEEKTAGLTVKNESDFYNKLEQLRKSSISDIEKQLSHLERHEEGYDATLVTIDDELFASYEDRIQKIKGRIISAINRAIESRDMESIIKLKELIERLEVELLSTSDN